MLATVHKLSPKQTQKVQAEATTDVILAEKLHLVDQAQLAVDEAWERVVMGSDGGEPDQMDVLSYEMALSDLHEAIEKAGL